MICHKCEGKGWIDSYYSASATFTPSIQQCPRKCNLSGYSNEVQKRLNDKNRATDHQVLVNSRAVKPARQLSAEDIQRTVKKQPLVNITVYRAVSGTNVFKKMELDAVAAASSNVISLHERRREKTKTQS